MSIWSAERGEVPQRVRSDWGIGGAGSGGMGCRGSSKRKQTESGKMEVGGWGGAEKPSRGVAVPFVTSQLPG